MTCYRIIINDRLIWYCLTFWSGLFSYFYEQFKTVVLFLLYLQKFTSIFYLLLNDTLHLVRCLKLQLMMWNIQLVPVIAYFTAAINSCFSHQARVFPLFKLIRNKRRWSCYRKTEKHKVLCPEISPMEENLQTITMPWHLRLFTYILNEHIFTERCPPVYELCLLKQYHNK